MRQISFGFGALGVSQADSRSALNPVFHYELGIRSNATSTDQRLGTTKILQNYNFTKNVSLALNSVYGSDPDVSPNVIQKYDSQKHDMPNIALTGSFFSRANSSHRDLSHEEVTSGLPQTLARVSPGGSSHSWDFPGAPQR